MMVCPQCKGIKYLKNLVDDLEIGRGSGTFTAPTQGDGAKICPTCVGVGYFTGAGS